jgi:hypothetical protein
MLFNSPTVGPQLSNDQCTRPGRGRLHQSRYVHGPSLIGPRSRDTAQQVGIDPVSWRGLGGIRSAIESLDAHAPHQRAHVALQVSQLLSMRRRKGYALL